MMNRDNDDLWLKPDHPLALWLEAEWEKAAATDGAPPRPISKAHGVYSLAYLARVSRVVRTPAQLVVALLLYRQCLIKRSRTIVFSNRDVEDCGIDRRTKYRALCHLKEASVIAIEHQAGKPNRITYLEPW